MKPILPTDWTGKYYPVFISMISHFNKPQNSQHLSTCGVYISCLIWPYYHLVQQFLGDITTSKSPSVPTHAFTSNYGRTTGPSQYPAWDGQKTATPCSNLESRYFEFSVACRNRFCLLPSFGSAETFESLASLVTPCWPAASTACSDSRLPAG